MSIDSDYTSIWTASFNENDVKKYHHKFFARFEKKIKHSELIDFVSIFLHRNVKWLDFPIGSGRLIDHFRHKNFTGADISDGFIEFNKKKGHKVLKKDLCSFSSDEKYDLITCTATLFAFSNCDEIIKNLSAALSHQGVLIFDITNKDHIAFSNRFLKEYGFPCGESLKDIPFWLSGLGLESIAIRKFDYYDNRFFEAIYATPPQSSLYYLSRGLYKTLSFIYDIPTFGPFFFKNFRPFANKMSHKYLVAAKKAPTCINPLSK